MSEQTDLLDEVVRELGNRQGDLASVARESGIPYDTVLRIKRRENDPGYSKVAALHRYLFPEKYEVAKPAKPATSRA
jgi:hypothetical protein